MNDDPLHSLPPKSLLVGATGQIGAHMLHLLGRGRALVTSRMPGRAGEHPLDLALLSTLSEAEDALGTCDLDAIYCIAGMTNVDACEEMPEVAYRTNSRGPRMLARAAHRRGTPFVYFSTEYVFDGLNGPYYEDDAPNPLSIYGRSKLQGELAVLDACPSALILRTTVVYGHDLAQKNFVYTLMRSLAAGKPLRVPHDQLSTPTYNRDLAAAAIALVQSSASGIFHTCGPERMDRFEFARTVATHLELDASLISGVPTSDLNQKAPRPLSAGLSCEKLCGLLPGITMRPLAEALSDCRIGLDQYIRHYASATPAHHRSPRKTVLPGLTPTRML